MNALTQRTQRGRKGREGDVTGATRLESPSGFSKL